MLLDPCLRAQRPVECATGPAMRLCTPMPSSPDISFAARMQMLYEAHASTFAAPEPSTRPAHYSLTCSPVAPPPVPPTAPTPPDRGAATVEEELRAVEGACASCPAHRRELMDHLLRHICSADGPMMVAVVMLVAAITAYDYVDLERAVDGFLASAAREPANLVDSARMVETFGSHVLHELAEYRTRHASLIGDADGNARSTSTL